MATKRTVVLIPCLNESKTIAKVIKDWKQELPHATIYVYDNASTDDTIRRARESGAKVCHVESRGKGNVVRQMFREIEADCYIMVDGDDTYSAERGKEMERFIVEDKADIVIGNRLDSNYFVENHRPFHGIGNRLVRWLFRRLYNVDLGDPLSGLRAMNRDVVKRFPAKKNQFEIEVEMDSFLLNDQYRICEIPITYRERPEGSVSKLRTYRDGIHILVTIWSEYQRRGGKR